MASSSAALGPAPQRRRLPSVSSLAYWAIPSLLCVLLYWPGLRSSYMRDDFSWLAVSGTIHDVPSLLRALFQPMAQGTIRPLSERLFFWGLWELFGLEALPARLIVFATQCANLVLLAVVARKLTASRAAGLFAPVLWTVNTGLYLPMTWTSAYNQVLCAMFVLAAFYAFLRFTETGDRRFYFLQWGLFVLGLGTLETAVMYPAVTALYAVCCSRPYWRKTVPMLLVSMLYVAVHQLAAPEQRFEAYRMHFDLRILETLGSYIAISTGGHRYAAMLDRYLWPAMLAEAAVLAALAVFLFHMLRRRRWLAAFLPGWFLAYLIPVLPLRDHMSDYYLTIPAIGTAILGAWALARAMQARTAVRVVAAAVALLYLVPSMWVSRGMTARLSAESRRVRTFVSSIAYAHRVHPESVLLVRNVDAPLFISGWSDDPFRLIGVRNVYLAEENARALDVAGPIRPKPSHFLPDALVVRGLQLTRLEVYEVSADGRLRRETELYAASRWRAASLPAYIEMTMPFSDAVAGNGWHAPEPNAAHRWCDRVAEIRLRGWQTRDRALVVRGYCPPHASRKQPVRLSVTVNGVAQPSQVVTDGPFTLRYALPAAANAETQVRLEVDPPLTIPGDSREYGLAFGAFAITP